MFKRRGHVGVLLHCQAEIQKITDLGAALDEANLELRVVPSLEPLKVLWSTTLHVSGIRLRNIGSASVP
jgi:hypothetical protein